MKHRTTPDFWELYNALPREVQELADKSYALLLADSTHPSLRFKEIEELWSVRVGAHYRALAYREEGGWVWFWIGTHAEYDKLMP
ncbi:MAG: hypothetical protein ACO1SX_22515 [Actinomycetota bacterium]